jgi:L-2,4-diaminobutyrate decarboxylase
VLFRQVDKAYAVISLGAAYLAVANIGVLGSHGAAAVPLLAILLAWGRRGISARIEHGMDLAEHLAAFIKGDPRLVLHAERQTGIVVWRPSDTETFALRGNVESS